MEKYNTLNSFKTTQDCMHDEDEKIRIRALQIFRDTVCIIWSINVFNFAYLNRATSARFLTGE